MEDGQERCSTQDRRNSSEARRVFERVSECQNIQLGFIK